MTVPVSKQHVLQQNNMDVLKGILYLAIVCPFQYTKRSYIYNPGLERHIFITPIMLGANTPGNTGTKPISLLSNVSEAFAKYDDR